MNSGIPRAHWTCIKAPASRAVRKREPTCARERNMVKCRCGGRQREGGRQPRLPSTRKARGNPQARSRKHAPAPTSLGGLERVAGLHQQATRGFLLFPPAKWPKALKLSLGLRQVLLTLALLGKGRCREGAGGDRGGGRGIEPKRPHNSETATGTPSSTAPKGFTAHRDPRTAPRHAKPCGWALARAPGNCLHYRAKGFHSPAARRANGPGPTTGTNHQCTAAWLRMGKTRCSCAVHREEGSWRCTARCGPGKGSAIGRRPEGGKAEGATEESMGPGAHPAPSAGPSAHCATCLYTMHS
jgi:hypothetical protein